MTVRQTRLLRALMTGGLSPRREAAVREQLRRDPELERLYESHLLAERALGGSLSSAKSTSPECLGRMSLLELNRVEARVLAAVVPEPAPSRLRGQVIGLVALLAAASVAFLVWWVPGAKIQPSLEALQGRGAVEARGTDSIGEVGRVSQTTGIRLYCISGVPPGTPIDVARDFSTSEIAAGDRCRLGEVLFVSYTNLDIRWRYLFVFAITGDGETVRYYPRRDQPSGLPISADASDVILGRGIRIDGSHAIGPATVVAVFSAFPSSFEVWEGAARSARNMQLGVDESWLKDAGVEPGAAEVRAVPFLIGGER